MVQTLLNDVAELKEKVTSLETSISRPQHPTPVRGLAAQRGGRILRSKRAMPSSPRRHVPTPGSDESDDDMSRPTSTTDFSTDTEREPESFDEDGVDLACLMQTGLRLRQLFATLLLFCEPSRTHHLWVEPRIKICDDLAHRLRIMGREPTGEILFQTFCVTFCEKI
jgi:hypothetical protein